MVANHLGRVVAVQCCIEFKKPIVCKESLELEVVNLRNLEFDVKSSGIFRHILSFKTCTQETKTWD